jgi:hypothetical protein
MKQEDRMTVSNEFKGTSEDAFLKQLKVHSGIFDWKLKRKHTINKDNIMFIGPCIILIVE